MGDVMEDRVEVEGLCIEKISDYKYKITLKSSLSAVDGVHTRFAQVYFAKNILPSKVTSLDGKTEYRITEDVLVGAPAQFLVSMATYSLPPVGIKASARRNVFSDAMNLSAVIKLKKVK